MNMNISELINNGTINLSMQADSKSSCIEQMANMFNEQGYLSDAKGFVTDVLKREEVGTTGIGFGVAIPHGKSAGVKNIGLSFAKLTTPLDWKALDGNPVSMVFLIAVPEAQAGKEHLVVLTTLARKLVHESFREQLANAQTPEDIMEALNF
jgi:PTS system fructose-specific IIA component